MGAGARAAERRPGPKAVAAAGLRLTMRSVQRRRTMSRSKSRYKSGGPCEMWRQRCTVYELFLFLRLVGFEVMYSIDQKLVGS
jgi:hypothetical protein